MPIQHKASSIPIANRIILLNLLDVQMAHALLARLHVQPAQILAWIGFIQIVLRPLIPFLILLSAMYLSVLHSYRLNVVVDYASSKRFSAQ